MEPAVTGATSRSFCICFEVAELLTRLCQPDTEPQAMVTKRRGHNGMAAVPVKPAKKSVYSALT